MRFLVHKMSWSHADRAFVVKSFFEEIECSVGTQQKSWLISNLGWHGAASERSILMHHILGHLEQQGHLEMWRQCLLVIATIRKKTCNISSNICSYCETANFAIRFEIFSKRWCDRSGFRLIFEIVLLVVKNCSRSFQKCRFFSSVSIIGLCRQIKHSLLTAINPRVLHERP